MKDDGHALEQLAYAALDPRDMAERGVVGRVEIHDDLDEIRQCHAYFLGNGWQRCPKHETGYTDKIEYRVYKKTFPQGVRWVEIEASCFLGVFAYFTCTPVMPW